MDIDQFIESCMDKGVTSFSEMRLIAQNRILDIDKQLEVAVELRKEKQSLVSMIKDLVPNKKETKTQNKPSEINHEDEITKSIIDVISKTDKCSPRTLIEVLGFSTQDPAPIYIRLKTLQENGILDRNENRELIKGNKWS